MKIPLWLIVLLFIGYSIWAANCWHNYQLRNCCGEAAIPAAETTGVPLFTCNGDAPAPDSKFADWKKTLLARGGQGDTLVITGVYYANEAGGERLARTRAEKLRDMMAPELPASRVRIATKMEEGNCPSGDGKTSFESASFTWTKMVLKKEDSAIIESDKDVILLFPYNSTEKEHDPKVDAYLKELCEKHKTTNTTFAVTGHTDDVGSDVGNMAFGLARAKSVAKILRTNSIAASRIQTASKGESEPVADNKTEEGRHQNRRVVITVNR